MPRPGRRARGFSLTELLVVTAVLLVLISLIIVGVDSVYVSAMQLKCQHRLEHIGSACNMYALSNQGTLPESAEQYMGRPWYQVLYECGHLDTLDAVACPSADAAPPELAQKQPPSEVSSSILDALRWLKKVQEPSGRWNGTGTSASANKNAHNAVTGLAMLLYLTAGCTDTRPPEFATTVKKGLEYMVSECSNGSFLRGGRVCMYTQGICMMAMSEAARRVERPNLLQAVREVSQEGIDFLCSKQNAKYGGFSYGGGGKDMSVTGWNLQAMRAALDAELDLPAASRFGGANTQAFMENSILTNGYRCHRVKCRYNSTYYLNKSQYCTYEGSFANLSDWTARVTDRSIKCPQCGAYLVRCWAGKDWQRAADGSCPKCGGVCTQDFPADYGTCYQYTGHSGASVRLTAAALTCRRLLGRSSGASDCQGQLQWIRDWRTGTKDYLAHYAGSSDLYTLYYITLALERMGGSQWSSWQDAFQDPLMNRQIKDGDLKGSWPDNISYGSHAGRGFTTTLAALTLGHMVEHSWAQALVVGECTYGYSNQLGRSPITPSGDTIMVMDYMHWEIDRDGLNPQLNDTVEDIAARHGGKANLLFADGRVEAWLPEDITEGMWTPTRGD